MVALFSVTTRMPRKYIRTTDRAKWMQDDLHNAINAVINDKMPIRQVGQQFNIPEPTVRRRLTKRNYEKTNMGPTCWKMRIMWTNGEKKREKEFLQLR